MTDPCFFNLRIIKDQRIIFKKFFCQRICLFIQFHLMQFLRIRSHFFHIDQTILQFIFSRELQNIICLSFLVLCKAESRMRSDCEINCLIRRILYFPFYIQSVLFQRIRHIQLKCVREHFLCLLGILQHISY